MTPPRLSESEVRAIVEANGADAGKVCVVAIRGYRLDSMGKPGENDRGQYDDAHFIVTPDFLGRFNGNTDPSRFRKGAGTGAGKGMGVLVPGVWIFGAGTHRGQLAFRQCVPFTLRRDGNPPYLDTGYFGINWHVGGDAHTHSAGCQTNPPREYSVLRPLLYKLLDKWGNPIRKNDWGAQVRSFEYILIEETARRAGRLRVAA